MTTTPSLTLRVSSRLMHDYLDVAPLQRGSFLCSTPGADDELDLFYVAPVQGTTAKIHHVCRDTRSASGFRARVLRHDFVPQGLAAGYDGERMVVFAIGDDRSHADVRWAEQGKDGEWTALRRLPSTDSEIQARVTRLTAATVGESLELYATVEINRRSRLFRVPWRRGGAWTDLGAVADLPVLPMTLAGGRHGVVAATPSGSSPSKVDVRFFPATGNSTVLQSRLDVDHWVTARDAGGVSTLVVYDEGDGETPRLLAIDGHGPSERPREIHRGTRLQALVAADAGNEPAMLFLLAPNGRLALLRAEKGRRLTFHGPLAISTDVRFVGAGLGNRGHAELMLGSVEDRLRVLWHQGEGAVSSWLEHDVNLPAPKLQRLNTYTTELSVADEKGAPWQFKEVELGATRDLKIHHAGQSHWIGPDHWLRLRTSFDGRLTVVLPSGGLDAPQLRVRRPASADIAASPASVVDPTYAVRRHLSTFKIEQVREILPAHRRGQAEEVHKALHAVLSVSGAARAAAWWPEGEAPRLADHGPAWSFEADQDGARFRSLTADEAAELRGAWADPATASPWQWLGDLLRAAASAVASVVRVVVAGAKVLVQLVIDGVRWVFEGVLRLAEQACRLVETIFHAVEVAFEQLFKALAWQLEQAREDVWRTHQVLAQLLVGAVGHLAQLARQGERLAGDFFAARRREVDSEFDRLIRAVGNQRFDRGSLLAALGSSDATIEALRLAEDMAEHQASTNWFLEKVLTPASGFELEPPISDDMIRPIRELIERIGRLIGQEFRDHVARLQTYFKDIATHPEAFASRTVAEVLREVKAILLAGLDLADAFAKAFLEVVAAALVNFRDHVLKHPVGGFLLQAIYDLLNPTSNKQPLTLGRLLSLIVAFPSAILYRLMTGRGPFEQADVDALAAEMARPEVMSGAALPRPVVEHQANGFLIFAGIARLIWSVPDAWLDVSSALLRQSSGDEIPTELRKFLGKLNAVIASIPLFFSVLTWPEGPFKQLDFSTPIKSIRNAFWLTTWAPPALSTAITLFTRFEVSPRGNPATNLCLSLVGMVQAGIGVVRIVGEATQQGGQVTAPRIFISLVGSLPRGTRFLGLVEGQFKPVALIAVGVVDLICHVLAGAGLIAEGAAADDAADGSALPSLDALSIVPI